MEQTPKRRPRWPWVAGSLFLAVAVMAGAYAFRVDRLNQDPMRAFQTPAPSSPIAHPTPAAVAPGGAEFSTLGEEPAATPAPAFLSENRRISIVLMGVDSDTEREEKGRGWRSDTIAVLVFDLDTPSCRVVNVPRDTRARVRRLDDEGKVVGKQYNKINSAFNFGGGPKAHGHENLLYSLNELFFGGEDSPSALSYYASIDMEGIAPFADAVDGVPVTLQYDVAGFGKKGETIELKGQAAEDFVRLRHGITGGSDLGRIKRQQAFVAGFAAKVKAMGAKRAVMSLWQALSKYVNTNLSLEQLLVLGDLLSRMKLPEIDYTVLPGKCRTIDERSYYVPSSDEVHQLVEDVWGSTQRR